MAYFGSLGVFLLILQSLKDDFDDARAQNLSDDARLPNMNVVLGVKTKHRCNLELAQITSSVFPTAKTIALGISWKN